MEIDPFIFRLSIFILSIFSYFMAQQQRMQMPGVFGGLMRYDDEYKSKFMMSPAVVVGFVIAIIVFVLILKIFFPISGLP